MLIFSSRGFTVVRFTCSLVVVACFTFSAVADIPPPPPKSGFKRVPFENVMKLASDIPGYKFYTFERMGLSGEETVGEELKLGTTKAIAVPSSSSPSVRTGVVAVPDKVMSELKTKEKLAKLLSRDSKEQLPVGIVLYETRGTIQDLQKRDPRTKVENLITISPDEKAGVKFTVTGSPEPPSEEDDPAPQPIGMIVGGIATTLGIVTLVAWYMRRK